MANEYVINVPLNLVNNEIRNAVLQNLSVAPTGVAGLAYYNTSLNAGYVYNGTAWIPMDATKATGIPISALAVDPLNRANQTGTQLSSTISDLATTVQGYSLNLFAPPAGNVSFASFNITNLANPVSAQDAATKSYVDTAVQSSAAGIAGKAAVVAVATTNIATLSGLTTTVDGVALNTAGERVLLTAQTTASQNGPWVVSSGAWTRPTTDSNNELETGAMWLVEQGTVNAASQWWLNSPVAGIVITPGTTAIGIVKFNASPVYTAGNGLTLTAGQFSVGQGLGILSTAGQVAIDTSVVARKYSVTIGDGTTTSFTITHNLGTLDITVALRNISTGNLEYASFTAATTNTATVVFSVAPAASSYRVTCIG